MKKKLIILLAFIAIACGLSAQTIVVKGTINNAVAGQKVWISYYSSPTTCNVNDTTSTNSSGAFTYSFTIGSGCAKNGVRVSMLSCVSIYDTLAITKNYDTSKSTDTLIYNFRYCDTCKTVAKFLGWADSSKALTAKLYNFSDSANKFLWRFGDGQTSTAKNPVSHTYASPGTYNVCLIATDSIKGCKDSICKGVFVNYACSNFKAKFGFVDSVLKVQFYDSSPFSATSYKWRFGDGDSSFSQNPSHTYSAVGTYNVCLIIRDSVSGCRDTLCKNVTIGNCKTVAKWTSSTTCLKTTFTNTSDSANKYLWKFDDNVNITTSSAKNPTLMAPDVRSYIVTLIAIDTITGCKDSLSKIVVGGYTNSGFKAKFSSSVSGFTANFYDSSPSWVTHYKWRFGDGDSSASKSPSHTYSSAGTYNACLIIRDSVNGCRDTLCKNITIAGSCSGFAANFVDSAQSGNSVKFTNLSSSTANKFLWKYGDGNTSATKNPTYNYSAPGTYTVCLIAYDTTKGCVDSICKMVKVNICSGFKASFVDSAQTGNTVKFTSTSTSSANKFTWKFGNGNTSTTKNPTHTYSTAGTYNVCLIVKDTINNCLDSVCKNVTAGNPCSGFKANFVDSAYFGNTATYANKSSASANKFLWKFGDGNTSGTKHPTHTYSAVGTYNVCLIARDTIKNCIDSVCKSYTLPCSYVEANFTTYVWNGDVSFYNTSKYFSTSKATLYFGDGTFTSFTSTSAYHTYPDTGTYNACLIITDSLNGCADTLCKTIKITNICKFTSSFKDSVVGNTVYLTNTSPDTASALSRWMIFPGSGFILVHSKHTSYTFSGPGTYLVSLTIYDTATGCQDSVIKYINIGNCTGFSANFKDSSLGGNTILFNNLSFGSANKFSWKFGDGGTSTAKTPNHTYSSAGTYTVCLIARDTLKNCVDSICKNITITNSCTGFAANFSTSAFGSSTSFTNSSSSGSNKFKWTFGDGNTSTLKNPTNTYLAPGSYTACLVAYDTTKGCKDSICKTVTSCNFFEASFTNTDSCKTAYFSNISNTKANKFSWNFGDATTSTAKNPTHSYASASTYNVCLIAKDTVLGCIDTLCKNITVNNSLSGIIYRDSAQVADSGMVWLIKVIIDTTTNDTILTPVDSTVFIASSGGYIFNSPAPGTYLIKAALFPGTSFYSNRIPTYYSNAVQWNLATYFTISSCTTANITLVKGTNPGGSGFVGGKVSQGANKVGDPLAKRQVLLFNANNTPYGYTFTDSNGKYTFSNVAFGTYRVQVEVLGKFSENYNITMTQQNQGNLNGNFDENSKYITLSKTTGIHSVAMGNRNLTLYPNPAENYVNLIFDAPSSGNVTIQISDMAGKQVFVKEHFADNGTNETQLDVAGLANGLYILNIVSGDTYYVGRLSINK